MKQAAFLIMFVLMTAQLALCETSSFQVGATIPKIIGVNYFPEQVDIGSNASKDVIKKIVMRNGQKMMLQTSVVR